MIFGGSPEITTSNPRPYFDDTWEWDGNDWTQRMVPPPRGRADHALAYDPVQDRTVRVSSTSEPDSRTWLYGALVPAAATPFGAGCTGVAGTPVLVGNRPSLGNVGFHLDVIGGAPGAPCVVGLAFGTGARQFGGGCTLYLTDLLLAVPLATATRASHPSRCRWRSCRRCAGSTCTRRRPLPMRRPTPGWRSLPGCGYDSGTDARSSARQRSQSRDSTGSCS